MAQRSRGLQPSAAPRSGSICPAQADAVVRNTCVHGGGGDVKGIAEDNIGGLPPHPGRASRSCDYPAPRRASLSIPAGGDDIGGLVIVEAAAVINSLTLLPRASISQGKRWAKKRQVIILTRTSVH